MSLRSYLYSGNSELTRLRDISEGGYPIPLIWKVGIGCSTEIVSSKIWNYKHPIAIKGDFKEGMKRMLYFYDYMKRQDLGNAKIKSFKKEMTDFFLENPGRWLDSLLLEAGEIFQVEGDVYSLEEQNELLFNEIVEISKDVTEILASKPKNILKWKDREWIKSIESDVNILSVFWRLFINLCQRK
jgi:hypothetical protein